MLPKNNYGFFCSIDCIAAYSSKRVEKDRNRAKAARKRQATDNDRRKQLAFAQAAFNEFIRLRDKGNSCISCGRMHSGKINAGHYRSVGAAPHLRFNQFNCHLQCEPCNNNNMLSGNIVEYRINLVKKIGVDKVEWIESQNKAMRWTIDEIRAIKFYFRSMVKRMKREARG